MSDERKPAGEESASPETRGHEPPASSLDLGHPRAEGVNFVQLVGEMHQPAQEAPPPTAAPPKPPDAAQSVTPPPPREATTPPPSGADGVND